MGKASNTSGLSEAVEENQNEVQNAKSIETGTLESKRTCQQQKRILENGESLKPNGGCPENLVQDSPYLS